MLGLWLLRKIKILVLVLFHLLVELILLKVSSLAVISLRISLCLMLMLIISLLLIVLFISSSRFVAYRLNSFLISLLMFLLLLFNGLLLTPLIRLLNQLLDPIGFRLWLHIRLVLVIQASLLLGITILKRPQTGLVLSLWILRSFL